MANINFDGKEYVYEELSDEAKAKVTNLQFIERRLAELQLETNALRTAHNTFASALKADLAKEETEK